MSRNRLMAKIRRNPDYIAKARHLDSLGLSYRVAYPNGRATGHPAIFITLPDGREVHNSIASTPSPRLNMDGCVSELKRFLAAHGVLTVR